MKKNYCCTRRLGALLLILGMGAAQPAPRPAFADTPDEQYTFAGELFGNKLYSTA